MKVWEIIKNFFINLFSKKRSLSDDFVNEEKSNVIQEALQPLDSVQDDVSSEVNEYDLIKGVFSFVMNKNNESVSSVAGDNDDEMLSSDGDKVTYEDGEADVPENFSDESNSEDSEKIYYNDLSDGEDESENALDVLNDDGNEEEVIVSDSESSDDSLSDSCAEETSDVSDAYGNNNSSELFDFLRELPSFAQRERSDGYSIDAASNTQINESIIRTLINKFLNQRFCNLDSDLNVRSNSLVRGNGFQKWDTKKVIVHLETDQINKVFNDRYGYEYSNGSNEQIPLSFYFDLSGSMSQYSNMLAIMAIELLKKDVKVLIGFNEKVNVQIDSISRNIDINELSKLLLSLGSYSSYNNVKSANVDYKIINENIDEYLIRKKAEKCALFSDFDPLREVIRLSNNCDVYWFCFESDIERSSLANFNGFIYSVQNLFDISDGLVKVNEKKFEALKYIDNPSILRMKYRGGSND